MKKQNDALEDLNRKMGILNHFRGLNGGTLSFAKENDTWQTIVITVDSGATDSVAPTSSASNVPIVESMSSKVGATYAVANGEIIHNLGQKDCVLADEGISPQFLSFQVCDVHKPSLSVSKLNAAGKAMLFHPAWSYIEDLKTGERINLVCNDGLYELHCWVRPAQGFARQGR